MSRSASPSGETSQRRLFAGALGTFVEWYDFIIYALTAPAIAAHFFPTTDPAAALLSTLAIFAIAFVARPIGGVLCGYLGDRFGRIPVMSATVLLMGLATLGTGILPPYASIGIAAPLLLVVLRLVQGLSAGGEHSGALSYVLESAPSGRRARDVGVVYGASFIPGAVAALLILGLRSGMGAEAYNDWGWRLPFILGAALGLVGLWLRMRLTDPEETTAARAEAKIANPLKEVATSQWRSLVRVILLVAPLGISAYLLVSYMYTFMVSTVKLSATVALTSNAVATVAVSVAAPFVGMLADRIGRKKLMVAGAVWLLAFAYPSMWLVSTGSIAGAFAGQLVLAVGVALFNAPCLVTMLELFRTSVRYSGHALAYNLGTAIFGGTTPFVAALFVDWWGATAPAYLVVAAALLGLLVLRWVPETRDVNLRNSVTQGSLRGPESPSQPPPSPRVRASSRQPVKSRE